MFGLSAGVTAHALSLRFVADPTTVVKLESSATCTSYAEASDTLPQSSVGVVATPVAPLDGLVVDGRNNVVVGTTGRPLVVVGLDDVVAVDAGDAILVVARERAQDVRRAVEELTRRGREDVL